MKGRKVFIWRIEKFSHYCLQVCWPFPWEAPYMHQLREYFSDVIPPWSCFSYSAASIRTSFSASSAITSWYLSRMIVWICSLVAELIFGLKQHRIKTAVLQINLWEGSFFVLRKTKKRFSVHKNLNYYVFVTEIK